MLLWGILVGFLFFLFYVFEMLVALAILFVIIGGLMTTVYFNQNKLLYMPGKCISYGSDSRHGSFTFTKSFQIPPSIVTRAES